MLCINCVVIVIQAYVVFINILDDTLRILKALLEVFILQEITNTPSIQGCHTSK